ncbi:MAG: hypothetical protein JWN47_103, partial [Frankiales bacterium]|nr:hypothetical protein [Frankiales bacterium]
ALLSWTLLGRALLSWTLLGRALLSRTLLGRALLSRTLLGRALGRTGMWNSGRRGSRLLGARWCRGPWLLPATRRIGGRTLHQCPPGAVEVG